jgi:hypothetical protein
MTTGCTTERRRNFIVLIDNSASVPGEVLQQYVASIQHDILPYMGKNDKLTVQFIDRCSESIARRIYTINLADMDFEKKTDGINHAADSAQARLECYITQTAGAQLSAAVFREREKRRGCGNFTNIVNAISEAKELLDTSTNYDSKLAELLNYTKGDDNYKYETAIVIYSDMINENPDYTLDLTAFGRVTTDAVRDKVRELKRVNEIPALSSVKVLVYGATSTKQAGVSADRQVENVRYFWQLFFKEAGADLVSYGYDTEIELKGYLAAR